MSTVTCPQCSQALRIKPESVGKRIRCPKCQHVFEMASETNASANLRESLAEGPAPVRSAVSEMPRPERPRPRRSRVDGDDDIPPERRVAKTFPILWLVIGLCSGCAVLAVGTFALIWVMSRSVPTRIVAIPAGAVVDVAEGKKAAPIVPNALPQQIAPNPELSKVLTLDIEANDLIYDSRRGHLLAAVSSTSANQANTITAFDPATGKIVWAVDIGSDPAAFDFSDDGKVLWVGLRGAPVIRRVNMSNQSVSPLLQLGDPGAGRPAFAEKLFVIPGTTDSVVASLYAKGISPRHQGVAVYDNGVQRQQKTPGHTGSNRIVRTADPALAYGYNNETTEFGLRKLVIDEAGIRQEEVRRGVISDFGTDILHAGACIYSSNGAVVDAKSMTLIGTVPARAASVTVDVASKRAYYLLQNEARIDVYHAEKLTKQASCTLPGVQRPAGSLIRLGETGLAFRTQRQIVVLPATLLE